MPGAGFGLKWPNDLLVGSKKLAGILCQSRTRGDAAWAAVGFGVNVGATPQLPAGSASEAVSLSSLGLGVAVVDAGWIITGGFVRRLRAALDRPYELRAAWLARTVHRRGDPLRIRAGEDAVVGSFIGLAEDGHLELEVAGKRCCFAAGELVGSMKGSEG